MASKKNGQRAPHYALQNMSQPPGYYVRGYGAGTSLVSAKWVSDPRTASHWPSRYAAKMAREVAGLSPDVKSVEVK